MTTQHDRWEKRAHAQIVLCPFCQEPMHLVSNAAIVLTYVCKHPTELPEGTQSQCGIVMVVPLPRVRATPSKTEPEAT